VSPNGPLTSVADLIDLDESLHDPAAPPANWAFRGQSRPFGTLVPSFQRVFTASKSPGAAQIIERDLMETFRTHYSELQATPIGMPPPYQINAPSDLRCLSVMQHYGVPTRLLDWTNSFWIAVYFACAGNPTEDAELWFYERSIFEDQLVTYPELRTLGTDSGTSNTLVVPPEPTFLLERGATVLAEFDIKVTPRMREQGGHHTVCSDVFADHGPLIHKLGGPDSFRRVLISTSCKEKALRFLGEHKDITASSIFPDVEGINRFLHWHLQTLLTTIL
jgi:hypothetical protein